MKTCAPTESSHCPFAMTDASGQAQNYGCLPSPYEIVVMRRDHGKTWACHENNSAPCAGAIRHLKEIGVDHRVTDPVLVTESDDWTVFATPK